MPARGPAGAGDYTVRSGDCMESIAFQHGFFWQTLWEDPANTTLKQTRKNPNVLLAGDRLTIPPLRRKEVAGATEAHHRFRRKGVPGGIHLQILANDRPRANERYTLEIDGRLFKGTTDKDGRLRHAIPPDAQRGRLVLESDQEEYPLLLGCVDPIEEVSGAQVRLSNLGFDCGNTDGVLGPKTKSALRSFQKRHGLPQTGQPDEATRNKLVEVYGC